MIGTLVSRLPDVWSAMAVTGDGGRTWTQRYFPASGTIPDVQGIACPAATTCYASGALQIPVKGPNESPYEGPSAVFITHDAGLSWSQVTFAYPSVAQVASMIDFFGIGDIQCPQVGACIALGLVAQGSKYAPVFTYRSTP